MFTAGPSYNKLKTNLRLAVNRLKLLEKKKTELTQKSRREIADYIANGKDERAKIRVEHIVREDYLVEAMELVEMYCDLLLARFGLLQQMKTLDDGLAEAISSLLWAAPRLQTDVLELKVIADQLTSKYGKQYAQACRENALGTVNEKLMHKLSLQAPPRILVERYLIEIAKSHNVPYEPDTSVLEQDEVSTAEAILIDFNENKNNRPGPSNFGGGGGTEMPFPVQPPPPGFNISGPSQPPPMVPFNYPPASFVDNANFGPPPLPSIPPSNYRPLDKREEAGFPPDMPAAFVPPHDDTLPPYDSVVKRPPSPQPPARPVPAPRTGDRNIADTLPELPSVPTNSFPADDIPGSNSNANEEVDFDDLTKRFEELKKRK